MTQKVSEPVLDPFWTRSGRELHDLHAIVVLIHVMVVGADRVQPGPFIRHLNLRVE
ncbi:hypothetical protein RSAG8_13880, partial [Rhizoctonia solani AG-8 WAC10335]